MQLRLKGIKFGWILIIALMFKCSHCAAGNSNHVSLTVEEGVSLVGTHCPGTVRLFCEGMNVGTLGWTYNGGNLITRIVADDRITLFPVYPTNPAFVSITISNISLNREVNRVNYFLSVLTVDLIELNKQHIKNITCGDLKDTDTQQVDISGYFTPNITAIYQSGILSSVEVQLQLICPSLTYHINLIGNGTIQTRRCMGASCTTVFTEFSKDNTLYDLAIVATNHSYTLKEFNLTIAYHSRHYFNWTVNSTSCQQYSVQCTATEAVENTPNSTTCTLRHTTDHGAPATFLISLNENYQLPLISQPNSLHYFEFYAMVHDYLLIKEKIIKTEPSSIELKGIIILTMTSLFLLMALIYYLLLIFFCIKVCYKAAIRQFKQKAHILYAGILLVLVLINVALLIAFGIITEDICNSNWTPQSNVSDVMIVVTCIGIMFVILMWVHITCEFCKHQGTRNYEEGNSSINNQYDTYDLPNHHEARQLNKHTKLDAQKGSEHYMHLRAEEKSKPPIHLTDSSYSYIDITVEEAEQIGN